MRRTTAMTSPIWVGLLALGLSSPGCKNRQETNAAGKDSVESGARASSAVAEHKADDGKAAPERTPIAQGVAAPDFSTVAHDGTNVEMGKLLGQPVVLFFYPKDDTPG